MKGKVAVLLDGHDEYKRGTNSSIDAALAKRDLWNCWMIMTSREDELEILRDHADVEAEIKGFTMENIQVFAEQFLDSQEKAKQEIDLRGKGHGIMSVPLQPSMICFLFRSKVALLSSRTRIFQVIVNQCMDREALKAKGQKAVDSARQTLVRLGKLAWEGLQKRGKKLIFEKVLACAQYKMYKLF